MKHHHRVLSGVWGAKEALKFDDSISALRPVRVSKSILMVIFQRNRLIIFMHSLQQIARRLSLPSLATLPRRATFRNIFTVQNPYPEAKSTSRGAAGSLIVMDSSCRGILWRMSLRVKRRKGVAFKRAKEIGGGGCSTVNRKAFWYFWGENCKKLTTTYSVAILAEFSSVLWNRC